MSGLPDIIAIGNLTRDPEMRFSAAGNAVCSSAIAVSERKKLGDGTWEDGETSFFDVVCFGKMAENFAESMSKGQRVIVQGRVKIRKYDRKDGGQGTAVEIMADEIGPSLKWATATVERTSSSSSSRPAATTGSPESAPVGWEEEPF